MSSFNETALITMERKVKITPENFEKVDFQEYVPDEVLAYASAADKRDAWAAANGKQARRVAGIGRIADMPQHRAPFEELLPKPAPQTVGEAVQQEIDALIAQILGAYAKSAAGDKAIAKLLYDDLLARVPQKAHDQARLAWGNWHRLTPSEAMHIRSDANVSRVIAETEAKVNLVLVNYNPNSIHDIRAAASVIAHTQPASLRCQSRVSFMAWASWQRLYPLLEAKNTWRDVMSHAIPGISVDDAIGVDCAKEVTEHYAKVRDEARRTLINLMEQNPKFGKAELKAVMQRVTGASKLTDVPDRLLGALVLAARDCLA